VPIYRLPPELRSDAGYLRGLLSLKAEAGESWEKAPDLGDLRRYLSEFRQAPAGQELGDQVQLGMSMKAFSKGHGAVALGLLEDMRDRVTPQEAQARLRELKTMVLADPGPVSARLGVQPLVSVIETTELDSTLADVDVQPHVDTLKQVLQGAKQELVQRLRSTFAEIETFSRRPVSALTAICAAGGGDGPEVTILPDAGGDDDDDEKRKLLEWLRRTLVGELSAAISKQALRLHREGESADDILTALKEK
jgi:hypothetical protein